MPEYLWSALLSPPEKSAAKAEKKTKKTVSGNEPAKAKAAKFVKTAAKTAKKSTERKPQAKNATME